MARKRRKRNSSRSVANASVPNDLSTTEATAGGAETSAEIAKNDGETPTPLQADSPQERKVASDEEPAKEPIGEKSAAKDGGAKESAMKDSEATEPAANDDAVNDGVAKRPAAKRRATKRSTTKPPAAKRAPAKPSTTIEPNISGPEPAAIEPLTGEPATKASPVGDHRLVAMLEIVNQLLAEQQEISGTEGVATSPLYPQIAEQLRLRAVDLDRRDAALQARLQAIHAQQEVCVHRDKDLRQREQEWVRQSTELASRRHELARHIRQHRKTQRAEQSLVDQIAQLSRVVESVSDSVHQESSQVREVLLETVAAIQENANRHQPVDSDVDLQSLTDQIESLQAELVAANHRAEELQSQNGELAGRVVSDQVNSRLTNEGTQSLESLPWEERKRLILARLEDEETNFATDLQRSGDPAAAEVRDELQSLRELVHQTDREIMRRDTEIAELRQLLEQQSSTVGDVAIGAAAIAGMLDQDDLVREERLKLQEIQAEWQEKLREAEIEVSLERAKLARERREFEKRNAELEEMFAHQEQAQHHDANDKDGKPARRWLARMGLAEE